jgi:predicted PurR-regulated permease PerM
LVIAATLLLAAALWSTRTLLSPLVCGGLLLLLLWPWRDRRPVRQLLFAVGALVLLWLLARARAIVYPALAALLLAFLLDPLVDRLTARRVPRSLAALAVLLPAGGLLLLFVLLVLPVLLDQARVLIGKLPEAYASAVASIGPRLSTWLPEGSTKLPADMMDLLPNAERILKALGSGLVHVGHGLATAAQVGSFFLLTPILTYYLLVDYDHLRGEVRPYFSAGAIEKASLLAAGFQETVSAWLKAQLLVALIIAVMSIAGFVIIGLPFALLLGTLAGALNLVPTLGFWVTAILAASAALFSPAPLAMVAKTAMVLAVVQLIEQNLLSPRIVGRRLGTKPVVLLLVMLLMASFLGVAGVLLAAPAIGLARGAWALWGPRPRTVERSVAADV